MSEMDSHPLRRSAEWTPPTAPQAVGEILSAGVGFLRKHFKVAFVAALPFAAVELLFREAGSIFLSRMRAGLVDQSDLAGFFAEAASSIVAMMVAFFFSRLAAQFVVGVASAHVDEVRKTGAATASSVVRRALKVAPRLLATEVVYDLVMVLAVIGPLALGVLAGYLADSPPVMAGAVLLWVPYSIVTAVFLTLRWALFAQAIVLEDKGVFSSLARSVYLMKNRGGGLMGSPKVRYSLILLIFWAVSSSIQSMFVIPLFVIGWMQGIPLDQMPPPISQIPVLAGLPIALIQVAANSVILPLAGILPTLFSLDARIRIEGLDDEGGADAATS